MDLYNIFSYKIVMKTNQKELELEKIIIDATNNFTKILTTTEIKEKYPQLYWGGNGVGDRWAKKKFNYSVILHNKEITLYSENDDDKIPDDILKKFLETTQDTKTGIIAIFVHSKRTNTQTRPIRKNIQKEITKLSCVICGNNKTICDHKNDLYNDQRVLNTDTQQMNDFQPLCTHCNLQKREICKKEKETKKLFSAKNIARYKTYPFVFPWEKNAYDEKNIYCKYGTYWFDPIEFERNIYNYSSYTYPIIGELKKKFTR